MRESSVNKLESELLLMKTKNQTISPPQHDAFVKQLENELSVKEKMLSEAEENLKFSEKKLKTMEDFTSSQKVKLAELEQMLSESEEVNTFHFYLYYNNFHMFDCRRNLNSEMI